MYGIQRGATELPFSAEDSLTSWECKAERFSGNRATFHYDTRDNLVVPTVGSQITAYAELNQNLRNGDHPLLLSVWSGSQEVVPKRFQTCDSRDPWRFSRQRSGSEVPLFERSSLGGQNNLRGYGVDRFIDNHLASLSIEERIHVMRIRVTNVSADFEVAPFVDAGTVFPSFSSLRHRQFHDYKVTPGIGFRGIVTAEYRRPTGLRVQR